MKTITRDLAIIPLGLGPIIVAGVGGSSPWVSIMVMETAMMCALVLDGYFRLKEGEGIHRVIKAIVVGMIIGIPLMALAMLFAYSVIEYLKGFA